MSAAPKSSERIACIDWHRGLAVLVMIECHALVLLSSRHDHDPLRLWLNELNGLPAPSFLFLAGLSLAYALYSKGVSVRPELWRGLRGRLFGLFLAVVLMRILSQPVFLQPEAPHWLRVDILECLLLSMIAAALALRLVGPRPLGGFVATAALGVAVLLAAPWMQSVTVAPWTYFVSSASGSLFPLFPWAGILLLGAAAGMVLSIGGKPVLRRFLVVLLVVSGVLSATSETWRPLLDSSHAWLVPNACERLWKVSAILLSLDALESWASDTVRALRVSKWLLLLGRESLAAYCIHLWLLFGVVFVPSLRGLFPDRDYFGYVVLMVLTVALTTALTAVWSKRPRRGRSKAPSAPSP